MGRKGVRNSRYKTKNRTRDIDQITDDVKDENISKRMTEATIPDEDRPGLGQFFCVFCDKYFINKQTLTLHTKQKPHKRRLKALLEVPHTQEEADLAAGISKEKYTSTVSDKMDTSILNNTNMAPSIQPMCTYYD